MRTSISCAPKTGINETTHARFSALRRPEIWPSLLSMWDTCYIWTFRPHMQISIGDKLLLSQMKCIQDHWHMRTVRSQSPVNGVSFGQFMNNRIGFTFCWYKRTRSGSHAIIPKIVTGTNMCQRLRPTLCIVSMHYEEAITEITGDQYQNDPRLYRPHVKMAIRFKLNRFFIN